MSSVTRPPVSEFRGGIQVLLASSLEEDHRSLEAILSHSNWTLYHAYNCVEAVVLLHQFRIPVIICESGLPAEGWKMLLPVVESLPASPRLIVSSRLADDDLWAEVLNLGAYDVLPVPFQASEVFRVASLAWHSSRNAVESTVPARKIPASEGVGIAADAKTAAAAA